MNFLAHFSSEEEKRKGAFSMLVAARDVDNAIEKFKKKILESRKNSDIFDGTQRIFIDIIIQINSIPEDAQITAYSSWSDDGFGCISTYPVDGEMLAPFDWYPDDKVAPDNEEEHEIFPFVEFDAESV